MQTQVSIQSPQQQTASQQPLIYFAVHPENVLQLKTFLMMNNIPFNQDNLVPDSPKEPVSLTKLFDSRIEKLDLSNREREVFREVFSGRDYLEIANRLFVSHETIRSHVKAIYRKLGVKTRAEAIATILDCCPSQS